MLWTRRQLCQGALGLGGLVGAGGLGALARAATAIAPVTDQYFVFAWFGGGWDILLGLDPRDPEVWTSEVAEETGIELGYEKLEDDRLEGYLLPTGVEGLTLGPYAGRLADHGERLAVVRGMSVSALGHQPGKLHALTGRVPAGTSVRGSSIATIIASLTGSGQTIPNLVGALATYNVDQPSWAAGLATASVSDLVEVLRQGEIVLADAERDALERFYASQAAEAEAAVAEILESRSQARAIVEEELAEAFDLDQLEDLVERFHLDAVRDDTEGAEFAIMAYQALTQGVSRCVTFRATSGLDSHGEDWRTVHGPRQQDGFNAVADLATALDETPFGDTGDTWLDHTTIVCLSEFGRGPTFNSQGGRGHYVTNAMALLGGPLRGGQVVGGSSDDRLGAQRVDLETGEVSESGDYVTFEHLGRTLLTSLGVEEDLGDFRVDPIRALLP